MMIAARGIVVLALIGVAVVLLGHAVDGCRAGLIQGDTAGEIGAGCVLVERFDPAWK